MGSLTTEHFVTNGMTVSCWRYHEVNYLDSTTIRVVTLCSSVTFQWRNVATPRSASKQETRNLKMEAMSTSEGPRNFQRTFSVALSPRANYTLSATATCRRNLVPTFVDRGVSHGQRGGSPTVVNLSFLDRNHYFSFKWLLIYHFQTTYSS
jgi:hypothetical protein